MITTGTKAFKLEVGDEILLNNGWVYQITFKATEGIFVHVELLRFGKKSRTWFYLDDNTNKVTSK